MGVSHFLPNSSTDISIFDTPTSYLGITFDPSDGTQTGCLNSPQAASSQKGEIIFDCVVARLVDIIRKEFEN